ncbi:uncharacterized, partial [Tachysurus ichikawai]
MSQLRLAMRNESLRISTCSFRPKNQFRPIANPQAQSLATPSGET